MLSETTKISKPLELRLVFLGYLALAMLAMIWDFFSRGHALQAWRIDQAPSFWMLFLGSLLVFLSLGLSWVMSLRFVWAQKLEKIFAQLLTPLSYFQILVISFLSGFVEEWFFRGILYSHFGLILSSILFGLCHLIPAPKLWVWSVWAFAAGLIFGKIYEWTDSLLLCALIHTAINASSLILLNQKVLKRPELLRSGADA